MQCGNSMVSTPGLRCQLGVLTVASCRLSHPEWLEEVRRKARQAERGTWSWKVFEVAVWITSSAIIGTATGTLSSTWILGVLTAFATLIGMFIARGLYYFRDACYAMHCDQSDTIDKLSSDASSAKREALQLQSAIEQSPPSIAFVKQIFEYMIHEATTAIRRNDQDGMKTWNVHAERLVSTVLANKHWHEFEKYGKYQEHQNPEMRRTTTRVQVLQRIVDNLEQTDIRYHCTESDLAGWRIVV